MMAAGVGLLLALVAAEAALRLTNAVNPRLYWQGRYLPGRRFGVYNAESRRQVAVRFNSLGFRGPEPLEGKSSPRAAATGRSLRRVAVIGDSFVAGMAVDEDQTFVSRLAARLPAGSAEAGCEPLNFGVSGATPAAYLQAFRRFVRPLAPDLLILCFFDGNDFTAPDPATDDPSIDRFGPDTLLHRVEGASRVASVLAQAPLAFRQLKGALGANFGFAWNERRSWAAEYGLFLDPPDSESARRWQALEHLLATFDREAGQAGIPLLIAVLPCVEEFDDLHWHTLTRENGCADNPAWRRDTPRRRLPLLLQKLGLPYVMVADAFEAAPETGGRPGRCYFGRGHFNQLGHELTARVIAEAARPLLRARGDLRRPMAGQDRPTVR